MFVYTLQIVSLVTRSLKVNCIYSLVNTRPEHFKCRLILFPNQVTLSSRGCVATSGDIWVVVTVGRHLLGRTRMLLHIPQNAGQFPQQKLNWPKMSTSVASATDERQRNKKTLSVASGAKDNVVKNTNSHHEKRIWFIWTVIWELLF